MATYRKDTIAFLLLIIMVTLAECIPAVPEVTRGGFVPIGTVEHEVLVESVDGNKPIPGHDHLESQRGNPDGNGVKKEAKPRFGTSTVPGGNIELGLTLTAPFLNIPLTTGASQYDGTNGHLVPGAYAPLNYDMGGLVLAGALALGTVFLLPKFLPPASVPKPEEFYHDGVYPPHGRVGEFENLNTLNETSGFANIISRLDENLLSNYRIDTTACAYRIICSAVQTARDGVANGKPSAIDSFIHVLTQTPLLKTYLPPAWRDIADASWTTENINKQSATCNDANILKRCPVNAEIAKMVLRTLVPGSGLA